jgi:hypothetical protein
LTPESFTQWFEEQDAKRDILNALGARLRRLHSAVLPVSGLSTATTKEVYEKARELENIAAGRSSTAEDLSVQKRLTYLLRIARGHAAVSAMRHQRLASPKDLSSLIRLFRDLNVPRTNLELTVCGGLPPFSHALVGKLVLGLSADPRILEICATPPGTILGQVFDTTKLARLLPRNGAVLLTTKGLFASHSAQYTRAELPGGGGGSLPLKKVGLTAGITASMVSKRTYQLAQALLTTEGVTRAISDVYGSGGSKRQRRIEAAVREIGLAEALIHPRIRRPIYAAALASNVKEVCLLNAPPQWIVFKGTPDEYLHRAVGQWRHRWLPTARRRLASNEGDVSGIVEFFRGEDQRA